MLIWLRNDNNVARVKLKRIETSIRSIIIKLSLHRFLGFLWHNAPTDRLYHPYFMQEEQGLR